ncbi:hypothetical protein ALNOE001_03880 [Candidatus Methanobinarius endosymbioticus]|uniref:Pyridoxamine 5'-phosphate oxidase putative domain-containing protein n=1 Tax=Candidatus Methanobinarius endosymbioticus TaxID=2006182 RepID=A0A366MDQ3_9EURY|nr:hypothetical protein ALNOE001_03880 [Candidatus Methanobinarius endosymbioticus]
MNSKDCLKLLREIKNVSFGTVDEYGNPQVRVIDVMHIDENNLYFLTARGKNFYQELIETQKLAICGLTKNYESICIQSTIKKTKNQKKWLNKIFIENPSMNNV